MPLAATMLVAWLISALPYEPQRKPDLPQPAVKAASARAKPAAAPFKTTLTVAQMTGKQAVLETALGTVVIDLRPDLAPNHVGYLMKLAGEGAYDGTIFH